MSTPESSREARAEARRKTWTGRLTTLAEDRPPDAETVQERLALLAEMSARAWALSGREVPNYDRANMPGRVLRPGDPREE
jgi:hypothetical protein